MMGTNRLTELLEQASAGVTPPAFAAAAWKKAHRVRRRRQLAAAVAAFVAVLTVAVPLSSRSGPDTSPAPAAYSAPPIVVAPGVDGISASPAKRAVSPLPATWDVPADVPTLSEHPVEQAVAVIQEHDWERPGSPVPPLYVLDTAGRWTRIEVPNLVRTHDEGGNRADPLRPASLSPDRRRVALPQPQALIVVDLTTGTVHRIPVPGLNEQVMWWGDMVLVGAGGAGVVRVDWRKGTVAAEPAAFSAWNSAGSRSAGGEVAELITDGKRTVRVWAMGSSTPIRELPLDDSGLPAGYRVSEWFGAAVHDGNGRIAAAAFGDRPTNAQGTGIIGGAQMLTVIDTRTGRVERLLDLGAIGDRVKGCCRPLEWIDDDTLLAQTDREGLIAWNVRMGVVTQVTAGPIPATVSIRLR
jgi:hypothetical protein